MTILPRLRSLADAGDDAGLDEVDDGIREHLGVDPEVVLVHQGHRRGRRDRADPQLERRPVRHEGRDVRADPLLDVADHRVGVGVRRDVDLDAEVDVVDVDEAVAERPRHRPVELDDDRLRRADGRVHRLDARPE